ncbi:MAG: hypothetical protein IKO25_07040 [Clostridia bacterium]|nr:hypothetical protein [Clostridia bacterium]
MKRFWALLLCVLCLLFVPFSALADSVSFGGMEFDPEAASIDLGDQKVENFKDFIRFLGQFPNLKKVDMFATQIKADQVEELRLAFPEVTFGWTLQLMKYKNDHIVRTDAEAFSTLHGHHPYHYSKEFVLLNYCTELLALDLGHNFLSDISFLANMPRLRVLILADNGNMKNIEVLSGLKDLEYLELFTCGITDISPLKDLPNLMDLNLCNNKVKDWRPLKEMKQLRRLWISKMCTPRMTAAEKQELQEALPDTTIVFDGEPTEKGWRKDPHYDIIYEIFHTGKYIPFAESPPLPGQEIPETEAFPGEAEIEEIEMSGTDAAGNK